MFQCWKKDQNTTTAFHKKPFAHALCFTSSRSPFNIGHEGARWNTQNTGKEHFQTNCSHGVPLNFATFLHIVSVNRVCERFFGKGRWDGVVSFSNSATLVHDPEKQKQLFIEAHMDPSNDGCGRRAEPPIWRWRRAKPPICRRRRAEEVRNTWWKTDGFPYLP